MKQPGTNSSSASALSGPTRNLAPTIAIDFETEYDSRYSVKTLGTWRYVNDPRFCAYLCATSDGAQDHAAAPADIDWRTMHGREWVSHNREFDQAVFQQLQKLGTVPADVQPSCWWRSAAACAYLQLPRNLQGAAAAVLGITVDKQVRTRMSGRKGADLLTPEVIEYAKSDARVCWELWQCVGPFWPAHERELFELSMAAGHHGLPISLEYIEESLAGLSAQTKALKEQIPWRPVLSGPALREWALRQGATPPPSTAKTSTGFLAWAEGLKKQGRQDILEPLEAVTRLRSLNRTLRVLEAAQARVQNRRVRYQVKYFGANTGRWSGDGGLNVQNFNRGEAGGVDLRYMFQAPPGKILGVVDYAQIESRVLLALAGDNATLERLRSGIDLYEAHARGTMGYADPRPLKEVDPALRQLAKARVLGLGFGCGAAKFVDVARVMAGLELSLEEAERIVADYRSSNPRITALWNRLQNEFRLRHRDRYVLELPSSAPGRLRCLIYREIDAIQMTCTVAGLRVKMYGGKLAENLTQATARDILGFAWLRCVAAGYKPILSVHDELVFELEEKTAEDDLKRIIQIMEQPQDWIPALPLKAEGILTREYRK